MVTEDQNLSVVHTCNPTTWQAETGRSQVQSQLGLHRKTPPQTNKQNNKNKKLNQKKNQALS